MKHTRLNKFYLPQRTSQGSRGTNGDRVQQRTAMGTGKGPLQVL